jgi:GNAT superfamily N-acetyltransferase
VTIEIRAARVDEAAALTSLAFASKAHWGYAGEVLSGWRKDLEISAAGIAAKPTFVAMLDGTIAGCYALSPADAVWKLDYLWVHPQHMGRGVGRALMAHAAAIAARGGASSIAIDADPNAEAFYLACGAARKSVLPAPISGEPDRVRPQLTLAIADDDASADAHA